MAYGLRFNAEYKNVDGEVRTIRLLEKDYAGGLQETWFTNLEGPSFEYGNSDSLFQDVIPSQIRLGFYFNEDYDLTDFVKERGYYKVEIVDENEVLIWSGFIESWDGKRPYQKPHYLVQMTASCGLNRLSNTSFWIGDNNKNDLTQWEIVQRCLGTIGIDRDILVNTYTTQQLYPAAPNPMTSAKVDIYRYLDSSGQWVKCREVLADILNHYNVQIYQHEGAWAIGSWIDRSQGFDGHVRYSGGSQSGILPWPESVRVINGEEIQNRESFSLEGGSIQVQGAIRRYTTNVDLGTLRDKFKTGSMQLWGPDGILGWQFAMPPASSVDAPGWWKFPTGSNSDPYALRINGFAPKPYKSSYKKWFLGKKRWRWHEPQYFVEPPPIKIKKTDGRLTVSYDYYTEENSYGFMYAIWLESSSSGNKLYYRPDYKDGKIGKYTVEGMSPEFTSQIAPAVPQFDPVTGKSNSKGNLSVTIEAHVAFNQSIYPVQDGMPPYFDKLYIRFYQMANEDGKPGDSYTIYNLNVADEEDEKETIEGDGKYKVVIEDKLGVNEDGDDINLLSGDYSVEYIGATFTTETADLENPIPTVRWHRRNNIEFISIYRAMMLDRLSMTWNARKVVECEIKILKNQPEITYGSFLQFEDLGPELYKIVRFSKEEYRRIVSVTCVEISYHHINPDDVIQRSFSGSSGLIEPGLTDVGDNDGGDGIYPGKESSIKPITGVVIDSETEEDLDDNARRAVLFNPVPALQFIAGVESEDTVDLADYFSEYYLNGFDDDVLEEDRHDTSLLVLSVIEKPTWINVEIEAMVITATATAPKQGIYYIQCQVYDPDSDSTVPVKVPVEVNPSEDFIEEWPPVFVDLPPLYFIAGKESTQNILLTDYLDPDGEHDGTGLSPKLVAKPSWATSSNIVFMDLSLSGRPSKVGTDYLSYMLTDAIGRVTTVVFEVIVLDPSFMTYELLNTSGADPVVIGNLPGIYELPERWDVAVRVKGEHDKYKIFLKGGGANADVVNRSLQENVLQNADGEYRFFLEDNGVVTEAGQFSLSADTYLAQNFIFGETIDFILYDAEFLEAIKFFLTKASTVLGEIVQDGTSSFIDPVEGNFGIEIEGIEHNKAVIEFDLATPITVEHTTPEVDFTYTFAGADFPISVGQHTVAITLYLDDEKAATRYAKFETVADKPKPIAGLKLISMIANTTDYAVLSELPEVGGSVDLPTNWNILSDAESTAYDYEKAELWELRGGGLIEISVTAYTRQPDYNSFVAPVTKSEFFLFRELNSTKIGNVHSTPSTFRAIFTRRIGGATGQIVAILKLDFSFGDAVDIEDTPIKVPGSDEAVDYMAGEGVSEEIVSFIKTFNVRVDNSTIEIFNPANPAQNWLRVKDKGITLAKLADITGPGLLGKTTAGSGVVSIVAIVSTLVGASNSTIPTSLAVKDAIDTVNAAQTWQAVMAKGNTTSIVPIISLGAATTGQEYLFFRPTDYGVGKPSLSIGKASTANIWSITVYDGVNSNGAINFNVQNLTHNGVRLVRENRQVIGNNGLTGGGDLSADRTISPVYGTTAQTVAEGNHVHAVATTTVAGFLSAADKVKLNNLPNTADTWQTVMARGAVTSIKPTISVSTATAGADYLAFQPTDYGVGKPMLYINKSGVADKWNVFLYDGANNNGTLNFYLQNLTHNDVRLVREDRQINTGAGLNGGGSLDTNRTISVNFGTTGGTVAEGNHTHVAAQITDFVSVSRNAISGVGDISYNSATGVISYTGGSGTVNGSGTAKKIPIWNGSTILADSSILFYDADGSSPALMYVGISAETDLFVNGAVRTRAYTAAQLASKTKTEGEIARQTDGVKGIYWYDGASWERLGGSVGSTTSLLVGASGSINASAALEVRSTTKGWLPPRMTCAQKTAIPNPEIGLEVYQTDAGTTDVGSSGWGSNFDGAGKYIFTGLGWWKVAWATF